MECKDDMMQMHQRNGKPKFCNKTEITNNRRHEANNMQNKQNRKNEKKIAINANKIRIPLLSMSNKYNTKLACLKYF